MNEGLFIILYLILVEKLNWELYCFSNQDKFFIFWSIKHFEVMGWEMLIKALALVSSFQGKIIQRVMNKKCEKRLAHIVMREPEVGKIPPVAIAFPKPSLIPCGDDQGIPPISIAFP